MTTKENTIINQEWLEKEDKQLEFELWCAVNGSNPTDEESLQFFRNDEERAEQRRKMVEPFSKVDGFFVEWGSSSGSCSVFNRSKKKAQELFSILNSKKPVQLFSWKNGVLQRIA